MYIRRMAGPSSVRLPDGSRMFRSDLPVPATRRWVASRKAAVARAVIYGLLSDAEAREIYELSEEELEGWKRAIELHGERALKATSVQRYRQP
ncbi:DUF1153 domain-containing protein [Maritimibacter sp. 55A14]|uniref:CtrA inhibitor SciP n=1 Tax=Maritimibacter sp. 55A14 TaxID=2174844 RepID=UPI000D61EDEB|nr:DUF1153 domain-containing protein [Maritimibacter sp. 55A14]PWE34319.1 DUF1153 domain-containing protein [Maritimibacter sp. 55A14]